MIERVTISIKKNTFDLVKGLAEKENRSVSRQIDKIICDYLGKKERLKEL